MARTPGNRFRIIAGDYRHRVLGFPDAPGLRPTPDRVRETLFNWLQLRLVGARCLDLCAGSGALSFEALSRGAANVTAVEKSRQVAQALADNARLLDCKGMAVINQDALAWLGSAPVNAADIIFLDPPYAMGLLPTLIDTIQSRGWLAPGGWLYLEDSGRLDRLALPAGWTLAKSKKAGQVHYGLCHRQSQ